MFNSRYRLCELFGIPIYVNFSFILLLLIFMTDFGSFSFGRAGDFRHAPRARPCAYGEGFWLQNEGHHTLSSRRLRVSDSVASQGMAGASHRGGRSARQFRAGGSRVSRIGTRCRNKPLAGEGVRLRILDEFDAGRLQPSARFSDGWRADIPLRHARVHVSRTGDARSHVGRACIRDTAGAARLLLDLQRRRMGLRIHNDRMDDLAGRVQGIPRRKGRGGFPPLDARGFQRKGVTTSI